ncbi:MAG: type II toxin-antitoxin system PemK/MazF family toxin [Saprospiraceae bacterium]|nr:type II toxin-antitoxin system PemK/MazF family toxin [Saprospiraceae bacterium]
MVKKYEIWLADLDPRFGAEPGKKRPVAVVQSDLINGKINTTMICPITTKLVTSANLLRLRISKGEAGLKEDSDVLVTHIRAIDNNRFLQKLGDLDLNKQKMLDQSLQIVLDV